MSLSERIAKALVSTGVSNKELADELGVHENTIISYKKCRGTIKGVVIERLANRYKFNSSWLVTGEGPLYAKESGAAPVDLGLLGDTISVVEEWLERKKRRLPPEKKAKVILYLYEEYLEREEKPEIATVERLLQLVA